MGTIVLDWVFSEARTILYRGVSTNPRFWVVDHHGEGIGYEYINLVAGIDRVIKNFETLDGL